MTKTAAFLFSLLTLAACGGDDEIPANGAPDAATAAPNATGAMGADPSGAHPGVLDAGASAGPDAGTSAGPDAGASAPADTRPDAGTPPSTEDESTGKPDGMAAALTAAFGKKAVQCGLTASAEDAAHEVAIKDGFDRCFVQCLLEADCDTLDMFVCGSGSDLGGLRTCLAKCPLTPEDGFACADGKKIAHGTLCDGDADCAGGEDESDCQPRCADGAPLASDELECDGQKDCADGSDERGCSMCE